MARRKAGPALVADGRVLRLPSPAATRHCGKAQRSESLDSLGKASCITSDDGVHIKQPTQQEAKAAPKAEAQGHYGVHFQRYSVSTYVNLPALLHPFALLPGLRNFLVVAAPSMDISAGLKGYKEVVPKAMRRRAPFLVVVDKPGEEAPVGAKYHWVEFALPDVDVFKLDLSGMHSFDEYVQRHLNRRHRRAWRVRQQELEGSPLSFEYLPLEPGKSKGLVDAMWGLYLKNGQRHGHSVLSRRDFYRIHLSPGTPGLTVLLVKDSSRDGQIVTFCTGVRSGDSLISMWCGTDYENPLSRGCSAYINAQYEFIRIAIEDPDIRWLDLGAQLRQMKTGVGCEGHAVAGYLRCKSKAMARLMHRLMKAYFDPAVLLTDP